MQERFSVDNSLYSFLNANEDKPSHSGGKIWAERNCEKMDYKTARNFLINQGTALETQRNPDDFLMRLSQEKSPVPGQQTSILLALKMVFDALKDETSLDKELVYALHLLSFESRHLYEKGLRAGVDWPFLLNEDLNRIDLAVRSIFSGTWQS